MGRSQRALCAVVLLALGLALLICALSIWLPMYANNRRLATFASGLYRYPLPPDTAVISRSSQLGKAGNGNSCWYHAQQSLVSHLSREEIEAYYDEVMLPRVSFGRWWNGLSVDGQSHFTLTLFDVGLDVTLDWRCH